MSEAQRPSSERSRGPVRRFSEVCFDASKPSGSAKKPRRCAAARSTLSGCHSTPPPA